MAETMDPDGRDLDGDRIFSFEEQEETKANSYGNITIRISRVRHEASTQKGGQERVAETRIIVQRPQDPVEPLSEPTKKTTSASARYEQISNKQKKCHNVYLTNRRVDSQYSTNKVYYPTQSINQPETFLPPSSPP
jgi:hypothetical protein